MQKSSFKKQIFNVYYFYGFMSELPEEDISNVVVQSK
jgi:hypothetical protein